MLSSRGGGGVLAAGTSLRPSSSSAPAPQRSWGLGGPGAALPLVAPPLWGDLVAGLPLPSSPAQCSRPPPPWPVLNAGAGAGPDLGVWPHRLGLAAPKPASQPITMATDLTTMWTSPAAGSSSCHTRCVSWFAPVRVLVVLRARGSARETAPSRNAGGSGGAQPALRTKSAIGAGI